MALTFDEYGVMATLLPSVNEGIPAQSRNMYLCYDVVVIPAPFVNWGPTYQGSSR